MFLKSAKTKWIFDLVKKSRDYIKERLEPGGMDIKTTSEALEYLIDHDYPGQVEEIPHGDNWVIFDREDGEFSTYSDKEFIDAANDFKEYTERE